MKTAAFLGSLVVLLTLGAEPSRAQALLSGKPVVQHASVTPSASATSASPGARIALHADVRPDRSIHIYGEGAKDFSPVRLVLTPNASITPGKPIYPKPTPIEVPGTPDKVPAYSAPFRISVPVSVARTARPGDTVTIGAALNYQACDDSVCYPVTVAPVLWTVTIASR
ncbi:MAG: hypothetical protein JSU08_08195 [Acidobacteria bacterium]|nr:hypothetical protein [Acidobacteriota bacterium]